MSSHSTIFSLECQAIIRTYQAEQQVRTLGGHVAPQTRDSLLPLTSINLSPETTERVENLLRRSDNQAQHS